MNSELTRSPLIFVVCSSGNHTAWGMGGGGKGKMVGFELLRGSDYQRKVLQLTWT